MSAGVRVVPWTNWSEWALLRSQLAANDGAAFSATLALYRMRRPSTLPHHVQSTASLLSFLIPQGDPHARHLALAMALVRLVNGSTDALQPRGADSTARPVAALAQELGMPQVLVDARHAAAHNALPRLDALEHAARAALVWLDQVYWTPQAAAAGLDARPIPPTPPPTPPLTPPTSPSGRTGVVLGQSGRKRRWRASGTPQDWIGMPLGVLPGKRGPGRLLGLDVSGVVGKQVGVASVLGERLVVGGGLGSERVVQGSGRKRVGVDTDAVEPLAKRSRVLSGNEKSELDRLMREMAED